MGTAGKEAAAVGMGIAMVLVLVLVTVMETGTLEIVVGGKRSR